MDGEALLRTDIERLMDYLIRSSMQIPVYFASIVGIFN